MVIYLFPPIFIYPVDENAHNNFAEFNIQFGGAAKRTKRHSDAQMREHTHDWL